jgi:F-type H+-transporting ATPase subunit b
MAIQFIIIVVIIIVLNKFVFKAYLSYLDDETEKRKKLEEDLVNINKLNKETSEKQEAILVEARKKADTIMKDYENLAKKEALLIKQQAINEADTIKYSALADVQKERENMLNDVKLKSVDLILKFNAKLFDKEKVNKDFVEKELNSF